SALNKPLIAITTGSGADWNEGVRYYEPYADAVRAAGGEPVRVAPGEAADPEEVLAGVQGLLLAGGLDVDLREYPKAPDLKGRSPEEVMAARRMRTERDRD